MRAGFTESVIAERFEAFPQTIKSMSLAMGHFERLLLDACLVHDNPVLSTCVAHTTIRTDANGNRAPDKRKATHRIDGTVALIMGLAMAAGGARTGWRRSRTCWEIRLRSSRSCNSRCRGRS